MAQFKGSVSIDSKNVTNTIPGDEVVISGISGVFPKSESVLDFMDNLYNKVDMIAEDDPKWNLNDPDVPKHMGKIKGTNKFDAQFFGVTYHLAYVLDPMARKLLEHAYGAIFDSGTNPQSIRGKRVGVFIGASYMDNSALSMFNVQNRSDFIVNASSKSMLANRISYWMDGKGPSFGLDCSDSSSTACLEIAYESMKKGECDAAIVGACNYGVHPTLTLNMRRAGLLCLDGKTKCFDKHADGYVRADAINVIFLQKAKDAHRIYAQVYHAKGYFDMRPDALFLPQREAEDIEKFLNEFYSETDLNPTAVEYIEAHGAALAKADENELNAIGNVFARDSSVKIGCVKSNMGNSESASGICALTKLCLAYHKGKLPANLHYNTPQDQVPAVCNGRIQVVTDNAEFNRGYTAFNNFSLSGANFHVLLKGHYKEKALEKYETKIPRIVLASGRQESCVEKVFDLLKDHAIDAEEIALLHKVFENDIPGHTGRGYVLLDSNENKETITVGQSVDYYPGVKRPLWFVYSGMGSQWTTMGADLMRIPTFAAAIHKCHKVLETKGLDLIRIVTADDNTIFDNILNAFVGIGAIQIGLTDVMKELGIVPDYIVGHSLGEMACAYHDDTFTAEELILSTYSRGKVCLESPIIKGSMAAVGVGYQAIVNQCPEEIDIACHNSDESTTISGPAEKMTEFVGELTKRGIFAKEVPCANIPYHSRYIGHCGPELLRRLGNVIKNPKKRSKKWISTSVPQDKWDEPSAVYSSAEYHTNNLLSPVLFEEVTKMIPNNAIVVEIAPHGLLQAILKRSHKECTHIPLTRRGNKDGVKFLLQAIGKIYEAGVNPKVEMLYPKVQFPVSTETPLLSHFIEWEHSEDWPELSYLAQDEIVTSTSRNCVVSVHDDDYKFIEGHVRDGANVLPESAVLVFVWETLAMHKGVKYTEQPIVFKNITFHSEAFIKKNNPLRLSISISRGNNKFEVSQDDTRIASGSVSGVKVIKFNDDVDEPINEGDEFEEEIILTSDDVYSILQSKGYSYGGKFKSIQSSNLEMNKASVLWNNNWITFIDSIIQLSLLSRNHEGVSIPKTIKKLRISILEQDISKIEEVNGVKCYPCQYNSERDLIRCAGVEIDTILFKDKQVPENLPDVLLTKEFYPFLTMDKTDVKTALNVNLQIISENTINKSIKVTQIVSSNKNLKCMIEDMTNHVPDVNIEVGAVVNVNIGYESLYKENTDADKVNVFIVEDLLDNEQKLDSVRNIPKDSFILALESSVPKLQGKAKEYFSVLSCMSDGKQILILLRPRISKSATYIPIKCDNKFDWLPRVYDELNKTNRVVLVAAKQPLSGAFGLVQRLRDEGRTNISLVHIDDIHAPSFDPNISIYKEQLDKNLTFNVLNRGTWGSFYYKPSAIKTNTKHITLANSTPGDLEGLVWKDAPLLPANNNLVQVSYAGLSQKDVETATDNHNKENDSFGMDFSGIDINGERVMGLIPTGALGNSVNADPDLLWPVPDHWTLQDAATVPLPYAIAYYCVVLRAHVEHGESIFITGGSGALGQALISICLSLGCTIYTTVSNLKKKETLLKTFPSLKENNIAYSRNDSFLHMIKTNTKNEGCNFVINCSSGSLRKVAMKCVAFKGTFLDLSSYDIRENNDIGMAFIEGDKSYKAVDFSSIFRPENVKDKKILRILIAEGIKKCEVKPITRIEYLPSDVSRAFRVLSLSKQVGKVLIKMRSPELLNQGFNVVPMIHYDSKGVYIVVCDENGAGIELVDRLVKRGARKVVMNLKSRCSGYLQTKFVSWSKKEVSIKISTDNLQLEQGCVKLLKESTRIGSIRGIFIVVNNVDDKNDKNAEEFVRNFNKTANTVINLDLTSKNYCNELSHFVVLSTESKTASDEYAMSVSEKVCQARTQIGLPALLLRNRGINGWSQNNLRQQNLKSQPQPMSAFFNAMEISLKLKYNNALTYNLNRTYTGHYASSLARILGFIKIDDIPKDAFISDLKVNESCLKEIRTLIRKVNAVDYPEEKIQRMTFESLSSIMTATEAKVTPEIGLDAFISHIDDEETVLDNAHPIVAMNTLLNNGTMTDLDPNENYLTMIPGLEGRHQIFDSIAERLKIQAVGVQMYADLEGNSISEIAATVRKYMKTKFETRSKFYLLGYSFGVNIALELAAILEKEGHIGVVFCLDSSPEALKVQLKSYLGDLNDPDLPNYILTHMYCLLTQRNPTELLNELEKSEQWKEKVDVAMKMMQGTSKHSNQYRGALLQSTYKRIELAKHYQPTFKLNSELVLIKGIPHPRSDRLSEDYNLSKYTNKPVRLFQIDSDHISAPNDSNISNIVNKMLDPVLLEEFKKKNLCDTYSIKANFV